MPAENQRESGIEGHVPALDGVRGLAILLVMVFHFNVGFVPGTRFETVLWALFRSGWWGVDLFFVLSGFLITGILLDAKGSRHFFRNFYMRRFLRIFPLYYGFLFVLFVVAPMIRLPTPGGPFEHWQSLQAWYWSYLSNYELAFRGRAGPVVLTHFWTLAVEEQFYIFWPAIVLLTSRKNLIRVCLFCVVGSLAFRVWLHWAGLPSGLMYRLTPARIDTLAIGALLAVFARDPASWEVVRGNARLAMAVAVAVLTALLLPTHTSRQAMVQMEQFGFPFIALASAALIVIAIDPARQASRLSRFFQTRTMRFLGKYSYAVYVFHLPVALILVMIGFTIATFPRIAGSQVPGRIAFTLVAITISVAFAFLSWHLYEKHFLKLKKLFPRRDAAVPEPRTVTTSAIPDT